MYAIQIISIIIFFLLSLSAVFNFRQTVLMWIPFHLLFNAQVAIRYYSPGVSLVVAVNIMLVFVYFIFEKTKRTHEKTNNESYILTSAMILAMISYIISIIFAEYPVNSGITKMMRDFLSGFFLIFLFQKSLVRKRDFFFFVKGCVIVSILIFVLGLIEFIFKDNPVLDFVYMNSPHDDATSGRMWYTPPFLSGGLQTRFGLIRVFSFFNIPIAFGVTCVFLASFFAILYKDNYYVVSKKYSLVLLFILLFGVVACNSKAPMLGAIILFLYFFRPSYLFQVNILFFILVLIVVVMYITPDYIKNFVSLFDNDLAEEGRGSTVAMRQRQMEVALDMFFVNPLFGNGVGSIDVLRDIAFNSDIQGAESIWLQILPERGLLGVFVYIALYLILYKAMIKYVPKKETLFFLILYLCMDSVTGNLNFGLWGCLIVAIRFYYKYCARSVSQITPNKLDI